MLRLKVRVRLGPSRCTSGISPWGRGRTQGGGDWPRLAWPSRVGSEAVAGRRIACNGSFSQTNRSCSTRSVATTPASPSPHRSLAKLKASLFPRLQGFHLSLILRNRGDGESTAVCADEQTIKEDQQEAKENAEAEWRWIVEDLEEQYGPSLSSSSSHASSSHDSPAALDALEKLVNERVEQHKPLSYLLSTHPFGPLTLKVRPPILIPRPETEQWAGRVADEVIQGLQQAKRQSGQFRVLDLCCGSGCIGLLLAKRLQQAFSSSPGSQSGTSSSESQTGLNLDLVLADKNPQCLEQAFDNIERNGLGSPTSTQPASADRESPPHATTSTSTGLPINTTLQLPDIFSESPPLSSKAPFDLILCNPPYIPLWQYATLEKGVKDWEDRDALVGTRSKELEEEKEKETEKRDDGLDFYRRIIDLVQRHHLLRPPSPSPLQTITARTQETAEMPSPSPSLPMPSLVFEVGRGQARDVEALLLSSLPAIPSPRSRGEQEGSAEQSEQQKQQEEVDYVWKTDVWEDYYGVERVVVGRLIDGTDVQ